MSNTAEGLDALYQATVWHVEERSDGRVVLVLGHHGGDDNLGYVVVEPHEIHFYSVSVPPTRGAA